MQKRSIIATVGIAAALVATASSGAVAAKLIGSNDIKNNSIRSIDVKNGTIQRADLTPTLSALLEAAAEPAPAAAQIAQQGAQGPQGEQGPKGDQGAKGEPGDAASDVAGSSYYQVSPTAPATTVANFGGSFGKFGSPIRATLVDTVTLAPGSYVLTANGLFHSTAALSGKTRAQLALRVNDGTNDGWGSDFGTCFTDALSPLANREATCSSTRVVTVAEETDVLVYAFGYADDQGSADSGKVEVTSYVTAVSTK